jgi:hypothetical protein
VSRAPCGRLRSCTGSDARTHCADWPTRSSTSWWWAVGHRGGSRARCGQPGLKTALVEKGDFASGTSSKSSKMIHGGLRYLQQGEFRLVYENLAERQRLLDNAPHLVSPLPFLIPLFGRDGVVSKTVARSYSIALWLYDLTGGLRIGGGHKRVTKKEALAHLPTLHRHVWWPASSTSTPGPTMPADPHLAAPRRRTRGRRGQLHPVVGPDDRARRHGCQRCPGASRSDDPDRGSSRPRPVVVNATGRVGRRGPGSRRGPTPSIRPAKGIHITVPADRLPCDIAAVIPVPKDRRSIFVVSMAGDDLVYLGHHRHRLSGPARRSFLPRGRRLPPRRRQRRHHQRTVGPTSPACGPACVRLLAPTRAVTSERGRPTCRRRHTVRTSAHGHGHGHRGEADDVPEDGRGHGRRRRAPTRGIVPGRRCATKNLRLLGATRARAGRAPRRPPGARPAAHAHLLRSVRHRASTRCSPWPTGRPTCSSRSFPACRYIGAEASTPPARRWPHTLDDVLTGAPGP